MTLNVENNFGMLSDSISESIDDILQSVKNYSDYSFRHKRRIVLALTHLFLTLWTLDRLNGDMHSTFQDAKRHASLQFNRAINGELSD